MRRLHGSAPCGIPVRCGGLPSLRRLRRSASAACFYFIVLFIFRGGWYFLRRLRGSWPAVILASPRDCPWHLGGPLVYAQDMWIRLRHFFYMIVNTSGACILCRLRGSVPAAFWLLPGDALRPLGVAVVVIFLHRLQRSVSTNT